jgi:hypothetical protein
MCACLRCKAGLFFVHLLLSSSSWVSRLETPGGALSKGAEPLSTALDYCSPRTNNARMLTALLVFAVFLGFCAHANSKIESYFAMCLIIKDGVEDLPEWIEYHYRLGASKFYIFDHNSTVPAINFIRDYVLSGLVDLKFTGFHGGQDNRPPQIIAYDKCLHDYGTRHRFMSFIDSDEYIVVVDKNRTIPDVLKKYEKYGGLALNWMMFGSSGHIEKPPGGVIANYYRCHRDRHVKQIVNTQYTVRSSGNPHHFIYKPHYYAVSNNGTRIVGPWNDGLHAAYDVIHLNHYNTKSRAEYETKMERGRGAMRNKNNYTMAYLTGMDRRSTDVCKVLEMPPPRVHVKV